MDKNSSAIWLRKCFVARYIQLSSESFSNEGNKRAIQTILNVNMDQSDRNKNKSNLIK